MMLLSSLGTDSYSEVEYFRSDAPGERLRTPFAPVATARLLRVQQALFFVTGEARSQEQRVRAALQPHGVKTGFVSIPPGRTAEEIEQIVATIFEAVPHGARVVADVTHGLRHLPVLLLAALVFLTVRKEVTVEKIFYGAFKARSDGPVPLIDLTPFLTLMQGFHAARQFAETGDARRIGSVLRALNSVLYQQGQGERAFSALADHLEKTSHALAFGLPLEAGLRARATLRALEAARQGQAFNRPLVQALFAMLEQRLAAFALPDAAPEEKKDIALTIEELNRQLRLIRFYAKRNPPFALLLLREWILSRCLPTGRQTDWLHYDRRHDVERQLNALKERHEADAESLGPQQRELASLWNGLAFRRNKVAHGGMTTEEVSTDIRDRLRQYIACCRLRLHKDPYWSPQPSGQEFWLVTPFGLSPGILYTALCARGLPRSIAHVLVVTSPDAAARLEEACQRAGWDPGRLSVYTVRDPFLCFDEAEEFLRQWRPRLVHLGGLVVNVTGGTTAMQYLVERLAREAEELGLEVERIALIDRRPPDEQRAEPYALGEVRTLESTPPPEGD
jgi:CRISPR-associated DxTHG motif protein